VVIAVLFGLVLLAGAVFAVSKFGGQVQQALVQTTTPKNTMPTTTGTTGATAPTVAPIPKVTLNITSPVDKSVVSTPTIKVSGTTIPNAEVAINELDIKSDATGAFSANLTLDEGDNPITIDAFDADGNTNSVDLTVTYEP